MKNLKFACVAIALCGLFSINSAVAERNGDGPDIGEFDEGGLEEGGFEEGEFDGSNGLENAYDPDDSYDQGSNDENDFDQDELNQNDDFSQQENFESFESFDQLDQAEEFNQTNEFDQESDFNTDHDSDQIPETAQEDEFESDEEISTLHTSTQNDIDSSPNAEENKNSESGLEAQDDLANAENESGETSLFNQENTKIQNDPSIQNIHIQNDIHTDQHVINHYDSNHGHHNWDHRHGHHHNELGLGFGLGMGLGFASIGGFGNYGFSFPLTNTGIGFYNSYTTFGPYRNFGGYYSPGSFSAATVITTPALVSPLVVTPVSRPVYVQQRQSNSSRPAAPIQKNNYWHYCRNPEGYFPYVKECREKWIKVPQQPS